MALTSPLVHVDDVRPENMKAGEGGVISEFRLPISGRNGSSTTMFHGCMGEVTEADRKARTA